MELWRCYLMLFALSFVQVSQAQFGVCVYETCSCTNNRVTCRNLNSIPPLVSGGGTMNITSAYFYAGNIASIEDNSLPPYLTTINFINNPISQISPNAFLNSATTLSYIAFRRAAFAKLPDALGKLQKLTRIVIFDTNILDWNTALLQNIGKTVTLLNLQNVGLKAWPDWINLFPLLQGVILVGASITQIPDGALDPVVTTLKTLNLNNASLSTIPSAISNLNLSSLSLSRNKLSNVISIPKSGYIDLSFNQISDAEMLSTALNPSAPYLHTLHLENNSLTVIPDFSQLIKLDMLSLRGNQISDPNSGSLPQSLDAFIISRNRLQSVPTFIATLRNLLVLYLSSNQITSFSSSAFPQQLEELHLDNNKITQLVASSFPVVSNLTRLYLQSNPIVSIHRSAFLPLKNLKVLNLDNTKLTQVPVALISLSSLNQLNMRNITTIICSCPWDTSLVQWFNSTKLLLANGSCSGGVRIKDFYTVTECGLATPPPGLAPTLLSSILCLFICLFLVVCQFHV